MDILASIHSLSIHHLKNAILATVIVFSLCIYQTNSFPYDITNCTDCEGIVNLKQIEKIRLSYLKQRLIQQLGLSEDLFNMPVEHVHASTTSTPAEKETYFDNVAFSEIPGKLITPVTLLLHVDCVSSFCMWISAI